VQVTGLEMIKILIGLTLLASMSAFSNDNCELCISYNIPEELIDIEIGSVNSCEFVSMTKDISCKELISLIGSEEFPSSTLIENTEVKNRYVYRASKGESEEFEQLFLVRSGQVYVNFHLTVSTDGEYRKISFMFK
jgi:hypothetical protein